MFQHQIRFLLLAVLAACVLALSGCGGGSSQTAAQQEEPMVMECPQGQVGTYPDCMDPPPTDAERISAAQDRAEHAAEHAREDANAAAMLDHQDDADVAAAVASAEAAASAAELARDLANDATNPDAAESLATQAEVAEGNAHTALSNAMTASTAAQTAMDTAAMIAATSMSAETKAMAITDEQAQTDDAGLGGSAVTAVSPAEGSYTLDIDDDGTTVTITVEGATDPADEDFMLAMDFMDGRTMHTRTHDADMEGNVVEEVVIVAEDRDVPMAVEFAEFESDLAGTNTQTLDVTTDTTNDDPNQTNEALAVDQSDATVLPLVMSMSFAPGTGDSTQHSFSFDDTNTADMDEADEVAGTYNGAMGTYRCNGTSACTVTVNDEGVVTAMSDGWIFTPDMGATSDQPDYDYLHYGFWLQKTTDSDGEVEYEVETFAGSTVAQSTGLGSVTGTASYTGGAVGVYVHRTFDTEGESEATSGYFNADASLTATFGQVNNDAGQGTIAPNMLNTLTGTIDNFDLTGRETQGWSVSLSGTIDAGGTATSAANSDTPFNASFRGPADADTKPHSVVGEFNASFTNGAVAGAFGARIDEE